MRAPVPAHPDKQGSGPVSERLVREPTRHRVPGRSLGTTPPTPRIGRHRPALDRGSIRLDQLADGDKVELVEAAEHGQVRGRESRVKHVEVFRDGEREELPSSGRPRPLPGHQRAQPTTPSIAMSHFDTDGASNGGTEAINGIIELGRRIARGFRNFEHYRLRMLLITGGLDASPHTQL